MIETTFQEFGENVEVMISEGIQGKTTSMELYENVEGDSKVNVMLSDVGDNADFGKTRVSTENHMKILNRADAVIVANWASNLKGTELMKFVFESSQRLCISSIQLIFNSGRRNLSKSLLSCQIR